MTVGAVEDAVAGDIAGLAAGAESSGLAAVALRLAGEMDDAETGAGELASCANQLARVLERLREAFPVTDDTDRVDDLAARRAQRRSGAADSSRSKRGG